MASIVHRYIGIDLGEKRVGIAISDPLFIIAQAAHKSGFLVNLSFENLCVNRLLEATSVCCELWRSRECCLIFSCIGFPKLKFVKKPEICVTWTKKVFSHEIKKSDTQKKNRASRSISSQNKEFWRFLRKIRSYKY